MFLDNVVLFRGHPVHAAFSAPTFSVAPIQQARLYIPRVSNLFRNFCTMLNHVHPRWTNPRVVTDWIYGDVTWVSECSPEKVTDWQQPHTVPVLTYLLLSGAPGMIVFVGDCKSRCKHWKKVV